MTYNINYHGIPLKVTGCSIDAETWQISYDKIIVNCGLFSPDITDKVEFSIHDEDHFDTLIIDEMKKESTNGFFNYPPSILRQL